MDGELSKLNMVKYSTFSIQSFYLTKNMLGNTQTYLVIKNSSTQRSSTIDVGKVEKDD